MAPLLEPSGSAISGHLEAFVRILAIISGEYGKRHAANIQQHAPAGWLVETWAAPAVLPPVLDYPEEYLPASFSPADLICSFGERPAIAELVPEIALMSGARAVIAPIDSEAWLPRGLARQLIGWLEKINVACVTPKPLCSLTENSYDLARRQQVTYADPLIAEFAHYFGKPDLALQVDAQTGLIVAVEVRRDAVCGCARYAAEGLVGVSADDAAQIAGLRHHHFPCLASMGKDRDYGDTLMHISGHILRDQVAEQVKEFRKVNYIAPGERSEEQGAASDQ